MTRTRTATWATFAFVVFAAVAIGGGIYLAKHAANPAIRIENTSNQTLEQLRCTLFANGVTWVEKVNDLEPGESVEFSRRTSDLYIQKIEYRLQHEDHHWQQGGIATTGEALLLRIGNQGDVSVSYGR